LPLGMRSSGEGLDSCQGKNPHHVGAPTVRKVVPSV
jgi:hypothetical protein